jgi:dienelactone hydrolase
MTITEFAVEASGLTCALASPPAPAPDPALLLTFSGTRQMALGRHPYDLATKAFVDAGHSALSFDLPHHGDRVGPYGEGIAGMCAALVAGQDPFARFVADGKAAIDACRARGVGAGGVFAYGISRGGYCALRLAAADPRIRGVAGIAPVTDWRVLKEFADVRDRPEVEALDLGHFAPLLARRPVFLIIGNRDARVGTHRCLRFAQRLFKSGAGSGESSSEVRVVDAPGHGLPDEGYVAGAQFLLQLKLRVTQGRL